MMEAVNSILAQTYQAFEFIIVNDGSSDSTAALLSSIQDSRVKIIHKKKNRGLADALNKAIKKSEGDWIVRQDADDISLPHRLEEQVKYIQAHPDVMMVCSQIQCINGKVKNSKQALKREEAHFNVPLTKDFLEQNRFRCFIFAMEPLCFPRRFSSKPVGTIQTYD